MRISIQEGENEYFWVKRRQTFNVAVGGHVGIENEDGTPVKVTLLTDDHILVEVDGIVLEGSES